MCNSKLVFGYYKVWQIWQVGLLVHLLLWWTSKNSKLFEVPHTVEAYVTWTLVFLLLLMIKFIMWVITVFSLSMWYQGY